MWDGERERRGSPSQALPVLVAIYREREVTVFSERERLTVICLTKTLGEGGRALQRRTRLQATCLTAGHSSKLTHSFCGTHVLCAFRLRLMVPADLRATDLFPAYMGGGGGRERESHLFQSAMAEEWNWSESVLC